MSLSAYLLVVYVPSANAEKLKAALFAAGAGRWGNYDRCCWQVEGIGQFRPLAGARPAVGARDEVTRTPELRLELLVTGDDQRVVEDTLLSHHPYETPAYYWLPLAQRLR